MTTPTREAFLKAVERFERAVRFEAKYLGPNAVAIPSLAVETPAETRRALLAFADHFPPETP